MKVSKNDHKKKPHESIAKLIHMKLRNIEVQSEWTVYLPFTASY